MSYNWRYIVDQYRSNRYKNNEKEDLANTLNQIINLHLLYDNNLALCMINQDNKSDKAH